MKIKTDKIFLALVLILITIKVSSQTYIMNVTTNNTTITTCSGTIYDSGGATGNYSNNEDYVLTICSENNGRIILDFTNFMTQTGDYISIYDGPSIYGYPTLINQVSGMALRGETIESTGTCITLQWHSNSSATASGYAIDISCKYPCQEINIGSIQTIPPYREENGIRYIDICQGDEINFSATGFYPENNTYYEQSDATSRFIWTFGDGETGTGNPVTYTYYQARGYEIGLNIIDAFDCSTGIQNLDMRVRVSTNPIFDGTYLTPDTICPGETVFFTDSIETVRAEMLFGASRADTTFLPDGSGVAYYSDLTFSNFGPDQTVISINDIEGILLNMEHSFLGDLSITIHCPNGQFCLLKAYNEYTPRGTNVTDPVTQINVAGSIGGGNIHLGFAPDPLYNGYPCYLTPGIGMDYWFTPTSTTPMGGNGTPTTSVTYTDPCGDTETWRQQNSGEYGSYESMNTLIGCPLNGTWTIEVRDNISSDNGYIFSWGIDFAQHLYPVAWDYEPSILNIEWIGENVSGNTAAPVTSGDIPYIIKATDNFGCTYDTVITVHVRRTDDDLCCVWPETSAGPDDHVCSNTYIFNASLTDGNTGKWEVLSQPAGSGTPVFSNVNARNAQVTVNGWGEYLFTWTEINNFETCFDKDTIKIDFYPVPTTTFTYTQINCFQDRTTIQYIGNVDQFATYNWDFGEAQIISGIGRGPYQIQWNSPEIHQVTLQVTANGCRSNDTIVNIQNPPQLTHQLTFEHPNCAGAADGWAEITPAGGTPPYNYSWASGTSRLQNIGENRYNVTVTDINGCTTSQQFDIIDPPMLVVTDTSYTNISCYNSNDGTISIVTAGGTGNIVYNWSDIGTGPARRTGLAAGYYQVTARDENGCTVTEQFTLTQPEELIVSISPDMIICEGQQVSIEASVAGGTFPYKYYWNGSNIESVNSTIVDRPDVTVQYYINVKDNHGCLSNTAAMIVTVSPKMSVDSMLIQNNKCFQSCDGRAQVDMTGGIPPFNYSWASSNHIFTGLCAGTYDLTITDMVGCQTSTSFIITEPTQLVYTGNVENATCYGYNDGQATIFVQGGTPEYIYLWPDGTNAPTLATTAGSYTVTVLDNNNCRLTANFIIEQPTALYVQSISDRTICKGQSTILSTQITGGTPPYDYRWIGSDESTFNANDFVVNPIEQTTYTLTVYDSIGCNHRLAPVTVNINPDLNIFVSVPENQRLICPGESVVINVNATGGNGGPYLLTLDDGRIVNTNFTINPMITTTYTVTLADLCGTPKVSDQFTIEVRPAPISDFTANKLKGCPPLSVQFINESSQMFDNNTWRFGDRNYSEELNPLHTYITPGKYSVSLEISDDMGCKHVKTIEDMINVYPKPTALFEVNPEIVSSVNPEVEFVNHSIGATNYFWNFGDGDSSINENPRHYYIGMGEYEINLIARNEFYCRDTASRIISVNNEFTFYMPTSFTPNGDGVNDCVRPCGNGIIRNDYKFMVYDKWGQIVFETFHYDPDVQCNACSEGAWDGTKNGNYMNGDELLPVGVYTWYCEFKDWNGMLYTRKGTILLVR